MHKNLYTPNVVDYATCYPKAVAMRTIDSKHNAEALFIIYSQTGFLETVLTDRGSQFTGKLMLKSST